MDGIPNQVHKEGFAIPGMVPSRKVRPNSVHKKAFILLGMVQTMEGRPNKV